jgi:molybdopterin molybdotransferase
MLSVAEARARILAAFAPLGREQVALENALGRVLAEPVTARVMQPPAAVSAMDGYAVRAADVATVPAKLKVTQSIAAGQVPTAPVKSGEAARIFTGSVVPEGADAVVIQENCDRDGDAVTVREGKRAAGQNIRVAGLDFKPGDIGIPAGKLLTARDIGLAASMNWPWLNVIRRPRIGILATGDELVNPGEALGPAKIIASNGIALTAFITACGATPINLGNAPDDRAVMSKMIDGAAGCDLLVTTGGASVGDHDLVQGVLTDKGMKLDFWKIAMRPGKPLMFGELGALKVLGLPGNPVSAIVTGTLFLAPAIKLMLGMAELGPETVMAKLATPLPANDFRQDHLRATLARVDGELTATPFATQDSSMLSSLAHAHGLIIRKPEAPAAAAGSEVEIMLFGGLW